MCLKNSIIESGARSAVIAVLRGNPAAIAMLHGGWQIALPLVTKEVRYNVW
jgi:hypothetical protein